MRVIGEPFLTREEILSILHPGQVTTESQFRTLRAHNATSSGLPVTMRAGGGHIIGSIQLYSALNADAARAFRLRDHDLARELASRAQEIERSQEAGRVRDAVAEIARNMPTDLSATAQVPDTLRHYLDARQRSSWRALDHGMLMRDWLAHKDAWLPTNFDELIDIVADLDRAIEAARIQILPDPHVSTFYGTVARMDDLVAEIEAADEQALLVPRDDLDRQGLARLGQAVAVLREVLPGGGSYSLPMPAVATERPMTDDRSPYAEGSMQEGEVVFGEVLDGRDGAWLARVRARPPAAPLAAPIPVA
ncbi:MAG TPA: hypothetical protein VFR48_09805 [Solirubrobacteraceae bacterium]|nr:hypothetical protein [Solirubrobacteraceae bacterium]